VKASVALFSSLHFTFSSPAPFQIVPPGLEDEQTLRVRLREIPFPPGGPFPFVKANDFDSFISQLNTYGHPHLSRSK